MKKIILFLLAFMPLFSLAQLMSYYSVPSAGSPPPSWTPPVEWADSLGAIDITTGGFDQKNVLGHREID